MIDAFRRDGLGQILDFVPNHVGVGGADNPLWLDVLEWGPDSQYAGWFDIDWSGSRRGKLLVAGAWRAIWRRAEVGKTQAPVSKRTEVRRLGL